MQRGFPRCKITMATSVQQVIDGARSILQDKKAPYRYSDDELVDIVNYAISRVIRLRPDLYFGDYPISQAALTISSNLPIPDIYTSSIVAYVAGWAELRDDEYTTDGRAAVLLRSLKNGLQNG